MRKVKYQAWIPKRGVMLQVNRMTLDNEGNVLHVIQDDPEDHVRNLGAHAQFLKIILREFTGLKDKNGVEIYEGDLLAHKFYNRPVEVFFKDGCFHADDVDIQSDSIEVIGNIYENPEKLPQ